MGEWWKPEGEGAAWIRQAFKEAWDLRVRIDPNAPDVAVFEYLVPSGYYQPEEWVPFFWVDQKDDDFRFWWVARPGYEPRKDRWFLTWLRTVCPGTAEELLGRLDPEAVLPFDDWTPPKAGSGIRKARVKQKR